MTKTFSIVDIATKKSVATIQASNSLYAKLYFAFNATDKKSFIQSVCCSSLLTFCNRYKFESVKQAVEKHFDNAKYSITKCA